MYQNKVSLSNSNCDNTHCSGGFLIPILVAILFAATSNLNEIQIYLETYNGKSCGLIHRTHGKVEETEKIYNTLNDKGKDQASMIILVIIDILSIILKPHGTKVYQSVGLVAVGAIMLNGVEERALIEFDNFKNCKELKDIRNDVSKMFQKNDVYSDDDSNSDDNFDDSSYEEVKESVLGEVEIDKSSSIRLKNNVLIRAQGVLKAYHVGGYSLPLLQSVTAKFSIRKNKFIGCSFSSQSEIKRIQNYVPALRRANNVISTPNNTDNILDVEKFKTSISDFQNTGNRCISDLKDPNGNVGSRCEVTSIVPQQKNGIMTLKLMKEGLKFLIDDVNTILKEKTSGRRLDPILDKIAFGVDAVVGVGLALIEMISDPSAVKKISRINQIKEFVEISQYLTSISGSFWSGYVNYKYSNSYASLLSCFAGRNLQSPHCYGTKEIMMNSLNDKYNLILTNLRIEKDSKALDDRLKRDEWLYKDPLKILAKKSARKEKDRQNSSLFCMICEQVLNTNDKESPVIELHPCKDLNRTDIIDIQSTRCQAYIAEKLDSLTRDQHEIFDSILAGKNLILLAPGGCGKTHVLKLAYLFLRQKRGQSHVILVAMLNNIAAEINGRTFNSYFGLGIIECEKEGKYVYCKNPDFEAFIAEKFLDGSGASRLLEIQAAKVLIIDEVIFLFTFLFSDYNLIEVFKLRIL